jgi:hypothetical protein
MMQYEELYFLSRKQRLIDKYFLFDISKTFVAALTLAPRERSS